VTLGLTSDAISSEHKLDIDQIPLGSSRLDTTRSTCRARRDERVEPCCSTSSTQPKCMRSTRRTCRAVSCRHVTSQVEFWAYLKLRLRFWLVNVSILFVSLFSTDDVAGGPKK